MKTIFKMNYFFKPHFFFALQIIGYLIFPSAKLAAQAHSDELIKVAGEFHKNGAFNDARKYYDLYLKRKPKDEDARLSLSRLYLDFGYPENALEEMDKIIESERRVDNFFWYYKARALHAINSFSEAADLYKRYLRESTNAQFKTISYYYLNQVGVGIDSPERSDAYFMENIGSVVNSIRNELRPIYSPNISDRIYFSSSRDFNRSDITIGEGNYHSDNLNMYSSSINQGVWANVAPMNEGFFTHEDEVLLDFNQDGMVAFFEYSDKNNLSKTVVDSVQNQSERLLKKWNHPVYNSELGDRDLFFFNDSTILFSSNREGGYGGYDLYVSFKKAGKWSIENLGPGINSNFHEISPFLTKDGRNLYFSSNCEKSMGGYDVFTSLFEEETGHWTEPSNLLRPINSGMDEINFRISPSGEEALLVSNRPGGEGGYDIYGLFYDHPIEAQRTNKIPVLFTQNREYESFRSNLGGDKMNILSRREVEPIFYKDNGPVLVKGTISKLEEILQYYRQYPHIEFLVKVYSNREHTTGQNLFQSYLKGEEIAEYLTRNGVPPDKIKIWTFGGQYPFVKNFVDGEPFLPGQNLNRRIEVQLLNTENLPVSFEMKFDPQIQNKEYLRDDYGLFNRRTTGLYYRIKFVTTKQVYRGDLFTDTNDALIEKKMNTDFISYYIGIYPTFDSANERLFEIKKMGYKNALIVAFDNLQEIGDEGFTTERIEKYPDLKKYLIYLD